MLGGDLPFLKKFWDLLSIGIYRQFTTWALGTLSRGGTWAVTGAERAPVMRPDLARPLSARELVAALQNLCFKYHDTMPLFVFLICLCELVPCLGNSWKGYACPPAEKHATLSITC